MMARRQSWMIVVALLFCYVYTLPRWADWSQNSRLDLLMALSIEQSVRIDTYAANTGDYALYNGHKYSDKAPGPVFLALPAALLLQPIFDLPFSQQVLERLANGAALGATLNPDGTGLASEKLRFFILQVALTGLTIALPSALAALALIALLKRFVSDSRLVMLLTFAYSLGTMLAVYSGNFYSHALVAALLLGAWALSMESYHPSRAVLLGLLLGWAAISEYPVVLPGLLIGLAALWNWRSFSALVWLTISGLLPIVLLVVYDLRAFGTPWPVGYQYSELWQDQHHTGFMSLTYPHPEGLWGLLFGLFRGMFVRAPWLLLAVPGYRFWWRSGQYRVMWLVSLLASLSLLLFYSSSAMWWGGFSAGPRYIVPMVPFLAVSAGWTAVLLWRIAIGRVVLVGLIGASVVLTWAEGIARQQFPPDTILNPWLDYTLPAWQSGDIARNLGMVLGLPGLFSLIPLVLLMLGAVWFCLRSQPTTSVLLSEPSLEGQSVASIQH